MTKGPGYDREPPILRAIIARSKRPFLVRPSCYVSSARSPAPPTQTPNPAPNPRPTPKTKAPPQQKKLHTLKALPPPKLLVTARSWADKFPQLKKPTLT